MKAGTQNHVKTKRLKRILKIPLYRVVGILETLWLLCLDCCDEGNIGKFTDDEIADYLEWDGKPSELVRALSDSGWTDTDDAGRPVIHDWLDHCPDYIKERVRKRHARASKANKQTTCDDESRDTCGQSRDMSGFVPSIPNPSQPNPTNSNPSPPVAAAVAAVGVVSWEFVTEALQQAGVLEAASAVRLAKKAKLPSQEALAIVRHFQASSGAWDPGAILFRLRTAVPGKPPGEGWPPPAKAHANNAKEREAAASRMKEQAEQQRKATADKAVADKLEHDFGAKLDELSDDELYGLVNGNSIVQRDLKRQGRKGSLVRPWLLNELAKREGNLR